MLLGLVITLEPAQAIFLIVKHINIQIHTLFECHIVVRTCIAIVLHADSHMHIHTRVYTYIYVHVYVCKHTSTYIDVNMRIVCLHI